MKKSFTVSIPDELWLDTFEKNKELTLEYEGPETIDVFVELSTGGVFQGDIPEVYNQDNYAVVTLNANDHPDIAYWLVNKLPLEREYASITNVDGSTYVGLDSSVAALRDYFSLNYDVENKKFNLVVNVKNEHSALWFKAEENKAYVQNNMAAFNKSLTTTANTYIDLLNKFQTEGKGSTYSWRLSEFNIADVPAVPPTLVDAIIAYNMAQVTANTANTNV